MLQLGLSLSLTESPHGNPRLRRGVGIMGTRGFARTSSAGGATGKEAIVSYRIELPYGVSAGWKVPYLGFSDGTLSDIEIDAVTITAHPPTGGSDAVIPLTFSGSTSVTIAHNVVKESDAVSTPLPPGTVLHVETGPYRNAAGGPLPYQSWGYLGATDDGAATGDTGTLNPGDALTRSDGTLLSIFAGLENLIRAYYPLAIVGRPHSSYVGTEVVVGFIGDSINVQQNDWTTNPYASRGFNGRWAQDATPFIAWGQSGSTSGGFISAQGTAVFNYIFGTGSEDRKITHVVDEYGINSIRTQHADGADASATWAQRVSVASICAGLGLPYVQTTLTPCGSVNVEGDASHGDAAGQYAYFVSQRGIFNNQVRSSSGTISGCIGFIDWQEAVESDYLTNGNTWAAGSDSGDQLHPGSAGHARMAAKINTVLFTANPNPLPSS